MISSKGKAEGLSLCCMVRLGWGRRSRRSALLSTRGALCMSCHRAILVCFAGVGGDQNTHPSQTGTSASNLEHELTRILDLAHTWRAVLLIDEADVFLEKRTLTDVHRNALVSVFLRLLEYYEGILFLTTNRVNTVGPSPYWLLHFCSHDPS